MLANITQVLLLLLYDQELHCLLGWQYCSISNIIPSMVTRSAVVNGNLHLEINDMNNSLYVAQLLTATHNNKMNTQNDHHEQRFPTQDSYIVSLIDTPTTPPPTMYVIVLMDTLLIINYHQLTNSTQLLADNEVGSLRAKMHYQS